MEKEKQRTFGQKMAGILLYAAAFLTPVLVGLVLYQLHGVAPFGDNSIGTVDGDIQYVDFFRYYRNVLLGKDSILYSFSNFLGETSFAFFAYYLASPLNLLILLFKEGQEHLFLGILALLKMGLCGLTATVYLTHRHPTLRRVYVFALTCGYALMQYNIAQSSNIMWLDGAYLFPLILLGLYYLCENGKSVLYIVAVTLSVLFNWYTAYFNCLAVLVLFLWELLSSSTVNSLKDAAKCLGSLAIHTISALLLSAFLFLPTILNLLEGKAITESEVTGVFTGSMFNVFEGFVSGAVSSESHLSLFCGSLVLFGAVLYFFSKRVSIPEKVCALSAILIMVLACYYFPLEYIANGFREITSYWYRYGYVIIFYLVMLAGRGLSDADGKVWKQLAAAAVISGTIFASWKLYGDYASSQLYLTLVFLCGFALLVLTLSLEKTPRILQHGISAVLAVTVVVELGLNGFYLMSAGGFSDVKRYETYTLGQARQMAALKEYDDGLYRVSEQSFRTGTKYNTTLLYNSPMADSFKGITHYSSTAQASQLQFMHELGYSQDYELATMSSIRLLAADSFLGAKYMTGKDPFPGMVDTGLPVENGKHVYRNPYALSFALVLPANTKDVAYNGNPIQFESDLYTSLLGHPSDIFKKAEYRVWLDPGRAHYILTIPEELRGQPIYGFIRTLPETTGIISQDYKILTRYPGFMAPDVFRVPINNEANPTVHLRAWMDGGKDSEVKSSNFYVLDTNAMQKATSGISQLGPAELLVENGHISAEVNQARKGESLLLTIPHNRGWNVTVNGSPTEAKLFADCLMRIPLREGDNEIELKYSVPGLTAGILLSITSMILTIAFFCYFSRRTKKFD